MRAPISDAVAEKGWDFFREAETRALKQAASLNPTVVSTGGGIVLRRENREFMAKTGMVVYLKALPQLLEERLRADFYQEMVAYGEEVYGIKLKKAGTK